MFLRHNIVVYISPWHLALGNLPISYVPVGGRWIMEILHCVTGSNLQPMNHVGRLSVICRDGLRAPVHGTFQERVV